MKPHSLAAMIILLIPLDVFCGTLSLSLRFLHKYDQTIIMQKTREHLTLFSSSSSSSLGQTVLASSQGQRRLLLNIKTLQ